MTRNEKVQSANYRHEIVLGPLRLSYSEIQAEANNTVYMSRWILEFGKKGPTVRLHVIRRPDGDRCVHDHPWSFWTIPLWGGYTEEVEEVVPVSSPGLTIGPSLLTTRWSRRVWPLIPAHRGIRFRHRIVKLHGRVAVTLVFASRQQREWGFFTDRGWMPWTKFVEAGRAARALWCADERRLP